MMPPCDAMNKQLAIWFLLVLSPCVHADSLAFFYALDADLSALAKAGRVQGAPRVFNGQSVTTVRIGAHDIFAMKMGSGTARTATAAATLFAKMPCDLALSTGPAGDVSDRFAVGQWIRISEIVAYQEGAETQAGFVLGKGAARKLESPRIPMPKSWNDLASARIASGETFVSSASFRRKLSGVADAVDMNLAGLTVACAEAGVPLACWKVISDRADERAGEDFAEFVKKYDGEGGRRIAEVVGSLPKNPAKPASYENLNRLLEGGAAKP
jgi:nucleoside phosphorylase